MAYERFSKYYDLIYQNINHEKECDLLEELFSKYCQKKPKKILDVGCGTGSHSIILSKRGYNITGIDASETMIEKARDKAKREQLSIDFLVQDMRRIKLQREFDCAICMFGGFGYIHTYNDLADLLSGLKKHLNKDSLFIFEFWNIGGLKPTPYQSWMKTQDKKLTLYRLSESNFHAETNILNIDFNFILIRKGTTQTFSETHKIRCYTLPEISHYLDQNAFYLLSAHDYNKTELGELRKNTFRILAISKVE
jgi:SAM-dependent methyltransferase